MRFDQHEKNSTSKALAVALKKTKTKNKKSLKAFYLFSRPNIPILQTFSRSGKLLGKFQSFFKNSRLCTNPDKIAGFSLTTFHWKRTLHAANRHKTHQHLNTYVTFCFTNWEFVYPTIITFLQFGWKKSGD